MITAEPSTAADGGTAVRVQRRWPSQRFGGGAAPAAERGACVPCMLSGLGVKVPCPGMRGAEGQGKRQGVTARWGLKDAWNERAGRETRTRYEVWYRSGRAGTRP